MDNNLPETNEVQLDNLRQQIVALEDHVSSLQTEVQKANKNLRSNLFKQIEILAVFVILIALTITNIIGIGTLCNLGIRGLLVINFAYIVSSFILLLLIRFVIVGCKNE